MTMAPFGSFERMLAWRYLLTRRENGGLALISVVSVVGVTLAVFALVAIMSIMNGFRHELLLRIVGFEPHVYVNVATDTPGEVADLSAAIAEISGVVSIQPMIYGQVLGSSALARQGVSVRGVEMADLAATALIADGVVEGSLDDMVTEGGPGLVIGSGVAARLGIGSGSGLRLTSPDGAVTAWGTVPRSRTYPVAAVFNVGNEKYDAYTAFMPLDEAALFFGQDNGVQILGIRLEDADLAARFAEQIASGVAEGRFTNDWSSLNAQFVTALAVERNVMRVIMMIVVAITALNIITGILMLVKNKGRDIAILRTIGATRFGITRIFLMTGSCLGAVGVLAGLAMGVAFVMNIEAVQAVLEAIFNIEIFPKSVYVLDSIPARLEWTEVAFVSIWAFVMTMLTALVPSLWASRLDPAAAMRM